MIFRRRCTSLCSTTYVGLLHKLIHTYIHTYIHAHTQEMCYVLRIVTEESFVFSTRERAPFKMCLEVLGSGYRWSSKHYGHGPQKVKLPSVFAKKKVRFYVCVCVCVFEQLPTCVYVLKQVGHGPQTLARLRRRRCV